MIQINNAFIQLHAGISGICCVKWLVSPSQLNAKANEMRTAIPKLVKEWGGGVIWAIPNFQLVTRIYYAGTYMRRWDEVGHMQRRDGGENMLLQMWNEDLEEMTGSGSLSG